MKKNLLNKLTIILAIVIMIPYFSFAQEVSFKDIKDSYVKSEIEVLNRDGIMVGMGQGLFNPKGKMNRAQLSAVLVRSLKLEEDKENALKFKDVAQGSWYAGYVGALAKTSITEGTSATTFSPNKNVNKQELAVFYIRALGLEEKAKELKMEVTFSDKDKISPWAKEHVGLAVYLGLMSGIQNEDGTFRFEPSLEADRELLADITYKLNYNKSLYEEKISKLKDEDEKEEDSKSTDPELVNPRPTDPRPVKPVDPISPTEPLKPIKPTDPKPVEPSNPPIEDKDEIIKVGDVVGKKVEFMGAYLISVEFNIIGNTASDKIELVINDGTKNSMKLKEGDPRLHDFYFDGMVLNVENISLYIGDRKINLMEMISWK